MVEHAANAAAAPPDGLARRAVGVIRAPRETFGRLRARPAWLGISLAVLLVIGASFLAVSATEVGRQAALDQSVNRLEAFGFEVDDARYASLERMTPYYGWVAAALTITAGPVALFALSGLIFVVVRRAGTGDPAFRQVLAMVAHTGVVFALQRVLAVPALFVTQSISMPTNVASLLPMLEESSFPARFLGSMDLFTLWWIVLLGMGIGVMYRRPARRLILTCCAVYAVSAGVMAAAIVLSGGS